MNRVVLDASAVMALFEERPGAERVERSISLAIQSKQELLMSVVNWGEVYYSVCHANGEQAGQKAIAGIAELPIAIVPADIALTKLAAELRVQRNLPYADCFAAALALQRGGGVLTGDKDFKGLPDTIFIGD